MTTKEITISGATFAVSQPYAAGHVLSEIEARVLNQTRNENVRNNTAKKIADLVAAGDLAAAGAIVAEYDTGYSFASAEASGNSAVKYTPLEREARKIARASITAGLQAQGRKIKDVDAEKLEAKITELATTNEEILKMAKANLSKQAKLAESLGDISV